MIVYIPALMFISGLLVSFWALYRFEGLIRRERVVRREQVRRALLGLFIGGLISGIGIGLVGMAAFVSRGGPTSFAAFAWAGLLLVATALGWPALLLAGFLARVNGLQRGKDKR